MQPFLTNSNSGYSESPKPPARERQRTFVYQDVDNLRLDPYEFRIYGHIARRGRCFASLGKIANTCCMSVRKVQYVLNVLERATLIHKEKCKRRVSMFKLTKPSHWLGRVNKEQLEQMRTLVKSGSGRKEASSQPASSGLEAKESVEKGRLDPTDDIDFLDFVPF